MKARLAKTAGFCMGVKRAVDKVLEVTARGGRKVYTCGPLIHNQQAVDMLEQHGAVARDEFDHPEDATVVIRAHGIPPDERQKLAELGLEIVDATCPHVLASQKVIRRHYSEGEMIVVVGDRDHAEVAGLLGQCESQAAVISTVEEAESLQLREPVCVVGQTTFDEQLYKEVAQTLRRRAKRITVADTICLATNQRQQEVRELAAECDCVVVVGGRASANTRRLAEIAAAAGVPAYRIETAGELDLAELSRYSLVGVTAGASTPSWITQEVMQRIEEYGRDRFGFRALARHAAEVASLSNLSTATAAFALTYAAQVLQGLPAPHWRYATIAFSYIFFIYTLNLAQSLSEQRRSQPARAAFYVSHRAAVWAVSAPLALVSFALAYQEGWQTVMPILAVAYLLGAVYDVRVLGGIAAGRRASLKQIPASKDVFSALAWTLVTAALPALGRGWSQGWASVLTCGAVLALALFRSLLFDLTDVRSDRILGAETLPALVGERPTRRVTILLMIAAAALLLTGGLTRQMPALAFWLLLALVPLAACMTLLARGRLLSKATVPVLVDGVIFAMGLMALGWSLIANRLP